MTTVKCDCFMAIVVKVFLNQIKSCEIKIYLEACAAMVKSKNSQKEVKRFLVCVCIYIHKYIYTHTLKNVPSKDCNKKDQHEFLNTHSQFSHHPSWFSAT